ncbi:MAG: sulfite exporter TauE/SafE family protein [Candidatus Omnitrophica bacterium]|nr:sulfite exporter TauE/SafE family protein [Candidatus Omnitrophota bacterium]MDD5500391.1 sulfite exporter TauE/SafE family protein [Candidatus Omnitrophota bacterium]
MSQLLYIAVGVTAGVLSGMLGIGGGIILIPALIFIFGLSQLQAQGTTLALMVPPIGLLAALRYYQSGNVKLGMAGFICLGFFAGGLIGANLVQNIPEHLLRRIFAVFLFLVSLRMFFGKA